MNEITSKRIIKSPKRINRTPSSPSSSSSFTRPIIRNKSKEEEIEGLATNNIIENSTSSSSTQPSLKRKYTRSPLSSPSRQPTTPLSRSETFASEYDSEDPNATRWTKQHWKKLEEWYIRKDRDYQKAANAFYYFESLIEIDLPKHDGCDTKGTPVIKELWPKEQIVWRSQCLDTSAKVHNGMLPSERKKKKRKITSDNDNETASTSSLFKKPTSTATSSSIPPSPVRTPTRKIISTTSYTPLSSRQRL